MVFDEKKNRYIKILSFTPIANWLMVITYGYFQRKWSYIFTGIVSLFISMVNIYLFILFWILGVYYSGFIIKFEQYDRITNEKLEALKEFQFDCGGEDDEFDHENFMHMDHFFEHGFADSDFDVMSNRRQSTPVENFSDINVLERYFKALSERERFLAEMVKYQDVTREKTDYVQYRQFWPTYQTMTHAQKYWYFYWRTEVRKGNYLDTGLSYIYVYIYELISLIGEKTPQDCYDRLIRVWGAYREIYPNLDNYLYDWTFDFCEIHGLEYSIRIDKNLKYFRKRFMIDKLIYEQENSKYADLTFYTIDAICNYSISRSRFYNLHRTIIEEAIPKAVALADAIYKNREGKGIFERHNIHREKKHEYFAYISSLSTDQYKKLEFAYKPYSTDMEFVQNIYEIARITQNTIMCLFGVGKNIGKIGLDISVSTLIESYVVNTYGYLSEDFDEEDFAPIDFMVDFDERFLLDLERKVPAVKELLTQLSTEKPLKSMASINFKAM